MHHTRLTRLIRLFRIFAFVVGVTSSPAVRAAEIVIPHKQTKPPNEPYSPAEAIAKMTVPPGFTVELVAAEPDIVNPVAMTFDERGRVWITESLEYPRRSAGPGRDRVKILEDTDGDGRCDSFKIFAEGLNIPSGIAVGIGGVWVANAPDILFYPDADRDDVPDGPPQVVVTGFGRDDTHELPNSLTWGPDGYLYGLNGVFNRSVVKQNGKTFDFTCAMFRIHPRTREFSLFCEGTSNPWGIAFNDNGDAFVSACVIDHLWHLVETGYYHRQGGAYPPFTWKLGSIVDYKHQMAAYCGITWFDSDAYPEHYRRKLYMGNIHGGCINVDALERNGATYKGVAQPDFLTANDAWFMPVVQKTGPDGCLYILDWYDRYHCYQDANRDPAGIDRLKGRLYRVRYKETPRAPKFDLTKETDDQLIERLGSPNIFYREIAQRLLWERNNSASRKKLEAIALDETASKSQRTHVLWTLIGMGELDEQFHLKLLEDKDSTRRAWAVRAAGDFKLKSNAIKTAVARASEDSSSEVRLQVAIAAPKILLGTKSNFAFGLRGIDGGIEAIVRVGELTPKDDVIPNIVWQNLLPQLPSQSKQIVELVAGSDDPTIAAIFPRVVEWLLAQGEIGAEQVVQIALQNQSIDDVYTRFLSIINRKLLSGELAGKSEQVFRKSLEKPMLAIVDDPQFNASWQAALMLCYWRHPAGIKRVAPVVTTIGNRDPEKKLEAVDAWAISGDPDFVPIVYELISNSETTDFRRRVFDSLANCDDPALAGSVLQAYSHLEDDLKPAAVELLTSRVSWSNQLLDAIAAGKLPKDAVNVNQVRKLLKTGDKELAARVEEVWGKLRTDRNPQREQVVGKMRDLLRGSAGDPKVGQVVFTRLCGQCHKIHGQGQDVGPDITVNGRASFEQLLSNIFDPSLVIGNAYRARIVTTADGRVLTGLLVEDSPQRVVLKLQGGKLETIARSNVEEMEVSNLSLMPEGVENQYKPQEIVDLFAFLKLDKPPNDPAAKVLPNFGELDAGK